MSSTSRWRAPVMGAVAGLVVAAAVVGPSALASGSHSASEQAIGGQAASKQASRAQAASALAGAKRAHATDASCATSAAGAKAPPGATAPAGDPGPGPFLDAVAQLKQAGTITDAQARVIDADIQAGSIDPEQLVASGTLTSAQMHAVADRLGAVKRSLAAAMNEGSAAPGAGQGKAPQG